MKPMPFNPEKDMATLPFNQIVFATTFSYEISPAVLPTGIPSLGYQYV
jgi:hypothetical protein